MPGLTGIGLLMLLTWPLVLFVLRDRPSDCDQYPDGEPGPATGAPQKPQPETFRYLLRQPAFWLITVGSFCSIGAIGVINQHMKLIFLDQFHKAHLTGPDAQRLLNEMFATALFCIMITSNLGRLVIGYVADRFSKKFVMVATYFLLAFSVPLALRVHPPDTPYLFVFLFGLAMGADYMMIPLVTAEQFGLPTLARAMSIILPVDTMAQACVPYLAARLREAFGDYDHALWPSFVLAIAGAVSISLLPKARPRESSPMALHQEIAGSR